MSWNDAYERKKHKENQKREIAAFKEAGMTEEQIQSFCKPCPSCGNRGRGRRSPSMPTL